MDLHTLLYIFKKLGFFGRIARETSGEKGGKELRASWHQKVDLLPGRFEHAGSGHIRDGWASHFDSTAHGLWALVFDCLILYRKRDFNVYNLILMFTKLMRNKNQGATQTNHFRYDRSKLSLKDIHNAQYISCMNPTAGSFTINPRLQVSLNWQLSTLFHIQNEIFSMA